MFNFIRKFFKKSSVNALSTDEPIIGSYVIVDPVEYDLIEPPTTEEDVKNLTFGIHTNAAQDAYEISQGVNCRITLCRTLNYFNTMYVKFQTLIPHWSNANRLVVFPRRGIEFNANYDRNSLNFYFDINQKTNKVCYAVDSAQVVSHECGHGILDAIRPDFWNVQSSESWAFHEAFGDIQAIVTITQSDKVIQKALTQTGGNLMLSNCISRTAGEMGAAIYPDKNPPYLRDVSVVFNYIKPELLPSSTIEAKLSSEPHNFSRVLSGAWYEILIKVFESLRKEKSDIEAFKEARDVCYLYLLKAIKLAPNTPRLFNSIAKMMLSVDKENGGKFQEIIRKVFFDRKILIIKIMMSSDKTISDIKDEFKNHFVNIQKTNGYSYVSISKPKTIKLNDHIVRSLMESQRMSHPIYDAEIEIANDLIYVFNKSNILIQEIIEEDETIINTASYCIKSILDNGLLNKNIWRLEENKLLRTCVECRFN